MHNRYLSNRVINGYKAKLLQRVSALNPKLANEITELKLPWYYIRNAEGLPAAPDEEQEDEPGTSPKGGPAEIFIYEEIGGSFGMDANAFIQDLQEIKNKEITVRINSPGGSVFDAIAIYNALVQHPANVTTRVDSLAASAASIIAMAGDKIEMMVGSQLMIHDAMGNEMGNAKEMREMAAFLDKQSDNLANVYAVKAGGTPQDWRALMLAETWMFADEAVGLGLADSVYTRSIKRELEEQGIDPTEEDAEDATEPTAEDAPPEETPAEEESEESDEPDEEDEEEPEPDEETKALIALMTRQHRTTNRGWKYTSRNKAPAPPASDNMSDLVKAWK